MCLRAPPTGHADGVSPRFSPNDRIDRPRQLGENYEGRLKKIGSLVGAPMRHPVGDTGLQMGAMHVFSRRGRNRVEGLAVWNKITGPAKNWLCVVRSKLISVC